MGVLLEALAFAAINRSIDSITIKCRAPRNAKLSRGFFDKIKDVRLFGQFARPPSAPHDGAAEGWCGTSRVGLQSLSAVERNYALPSIKATLWSGSMPNFGAAARMASAI
jgi:hypothetical protein